MKSIHEESSSFIKNSCNPDWRVIKAAEAGVEKGYEVTIFAMWENESALEEINNVKYVRIYPSLIFLETNRKEIQTDSIILWRFYC